MFYDVFVGCDSQGDYCIYVQRLNEEAEHVGYVSISEYQKIAEDLEERLNATPAPNG